MIRNLSAAIAVGLVTTAACAQPKLLLIHADFPNASSSSTQVQRQKAIDEAVAFWREVSHGKVDIQATATPNLMLATPRADDGECPLSTIKREAGAAAKAAGFDPDGYDYVNYTFPKPRGCPKFGQTYGPKDTYIYANYNYKTPYAHELGHNFGLGHASVIRCPSSVNSIEEGKCPSLGEYSDPYNVMSRHPHFGWPSAWALHRMKFIGDDQLARYEGGDRTYLITPLETKGGLKSVVVPVGNHFIWAEYRTQTGSDINASRPEGAILRVASSGNPAYFNPGTKTECWDTCMLDLTPDTAGTGLGKYDTPLGVGKSWIDLGTTFTVQSIDASGLTLRVTPSHMVPAPGTPATVPVVEYFHSGFGHYFITSFPDEISKLDEGASVGWSRTGSSFKVFADSQAGLADVCRFFSTSFSPKSSHFFTPDAIECAKVQANPHWQFEAIAFYMPFADGSGYCPAAHDQVYRLYNNGQGGAPNHRYTTSLSVRAQMISQGWIPEGNGSTGVIMCAPL